MQKYKKGDLVHVVKDLGSCMRHFEADCDAIIIGSYKDKYGGDDKDRQYTIHIKDHGETSWYYEEQLELIEKNRLDLLEVWEKEEDEEKEKCSDLDWIFSNGNKILHGATGASISALAACLGIKNLWGSHGEGFVYYQNAMMVLHIAKPFLEASDKIGWLAFAGKDRTSCAQGSAPNTKDAQFTDSQQPQVKTAEGSGS